MSEDHTRDVTSLRSALAQLNMHLDTMADRHPALDEDDAWLKVLQRITSDDLEALLRDAGFVWSKLGDFVQALQTFCIQRRQQG